MWHNKQEREGGKGPAAIRSKGRQGSRTGIAQLQELLQHHSKGHKAGTSPPRAVGQGQGQAEPNRRQKEAETRVKALLPLPGEGCTAGHSSCAGHGMNLAPWGWALARQHYPGPACCMDSRSKLE